MTRPDMGDADITALRDECSRIGIDMHEVAGLAFSGSEALAYFLDLLRETPSGVGLEGFRQQMRLKGVDLWTAGQK